MAKDPAVLFYTNDFLTGCAGLTMEERGQYITLLCLQHQQGHISEKTCRLTVGSVSVDVLAKFKKDENGLFFNERMEIEIDKRRNYEETKRLNGLKGGRPKTEKKPIGYPTGKPIANLTENVNEDENGNVVELSKDGFFLNDLPKDLKLSEMDIGKTIQFVKFTVRQDVTESQVAEYWEAFKIQWFEKKEWKNSIEDLMSHFRNSFKQQKFNQHESAKRSTGNRNSPDLSLLGDNREPL